MTPMEQVAQFTRAMGQVVAEHEIDPQTALLRQSLVMEEAKEVSSELLRFKVDPVSLTKELADLLYVVYGTAVAFDLPLEAAFDRVHKSNMSKLNADGRPDYRRDGKVKKGPNYQPPDLHDLFEGRKTKPSSS